MGRVCTEAKLTPGLTGCRPPPLAIIVIVIILVHLSLLLDSLADQYDKLFLGLKCSKSRIC